MSDTAVQVGRLRLMAARDAPVHTLRARVEDALRTSSKPTSLSHRFVLVRRLRLRLPPGASVQGLAVRLEAQWREIERLAEPIAQAGDAARAVWAVDEVQARLALLQRCLQGRECGAWFWRRLVPPAALAQPLPQRLAALLLEPLASSEARPLADGAMRRTLWAAAWPAIEAAGWGDGVREACPAAQRACVDEAVALAWRTSARPALPIAAGAAQAGGLPPPPTPAAVAGAASPTGPGRTTGASPPPERPTARAPSLAAAPGLVTGLPAAPAAMSSASPHWLSGPVPRLTPVPPPDEGRLDVQPTHEAEGVATAWAGLWFLLPLALQLRLDEEVDAPQLLAAVLQHAVDHLGLDRPTRHWVAQQATASDLDAPALPAFAPRAGHWWRRLRIHSLQRAHLPLRRVLHRPGRVFLAAHRVDVVLPLHAADVRIRRAGFDIDPGYLPWLDTVVRFHYLA